MKIDVYLVGKTIYLIGALDFIEINPIGALHMAAILGRELGREYFIEYYKSYDRFRECNSSTYVGSVEVMDTGARTAHEIISLLYKHTGGD